MTARTRNRVLQVTIPGTFINFGTPVVGNNVIGDEESCSDHIGNYPSANSFSHSKKTRCYPCLWGQQPPTLNRQYFGYPMGYRNNLAPDPRSAYPLPGLVECNQLAWRILAETNPSSPHVNIPAFFGEFRDLPGLLRGWGRGVIHNVAKGYISWRWAVKPMVNDVNKLVRFVEACNQRFNELRKLRDGKTLRRRVTLGTWEQSTATTNELLHSQGCFISGRRKTVYSKKLWGSAEWKLLPNTFIPNMSDDELMKFTRRVMSGINSHGALEAAWELLPWSWFIDWFSNVGTMLSATNNSVPCTWGRLCLMMTTKSVLDIETTPADRPSWVELRGSFQNEWVRKDRQVVYPVIPVPLPYLPILDGGKLSILAALAVLRR